MNHAVKTKVTKAVYILEFKPSTAQIALGQRRTKQDDLPYRHKGKSIILLVIASDQAKRNIAEGKMAQILKKFQFQKRSR
ncbi:MAG: hypothetical protein DYG89_39990 [Caldilinea sp. CFX5]|nr:hypothetical protein [Caldilinea sp. CFX5]